MKWFPSLICIVNPRHKVTEGFFPQVSKWVCKLHRVHFLSCNWNSEVSQAEQIWQVSTDKMPAVELTVVSGLINREAQGEKKLEDSAFVPITANPFSCRESGDPPAGSLWLLRAMETEEKKECLLLPHPERRQSQELSSVFCLCSSSAFSDENVTLFRRGLKYVKQRDISQTNPVMSISAGCVCVRVHARIFTSISRGSRRCSLPHRY